MFNVSLTLTQAVDGSESEGLLFNTTNTGVTVYPSLADPSTIEYVLTGSNSYSAYQQVSNAKVVKNQVNEKRLLLIKISRSSYGLG